MLWARFAFWAGVMVAFGVAVLLMEWRINALLGCPLSILTGYLAARWIVRLGSR